MSKRAIQGATAFVSHAFDYSLAGKHAPLPRTAAATSELRNLLSPLLVGLSVPSTASASDVFGLIKQRLRSCEETERLVIHLAGHGRLFGDDHFMLDGDTGDYLDDDSALSARALSVCLAQTRAAKVLIIIDACYAGGAGASAARALDACFAQANAAPGFAVQILTSSAQTEPADDGMFAEALIEVLQSGGEIDGEHYWAENDRFIHTDRLRDALEDFFAAKHGEQYRNAVQLRGWGAVRAMLPNPRHAVVADVEVDYKRLAAEHFTRSASGLEIGETGWFFAGRTEILREIVVRLRSPQASMLVVTGPPGSGKSAIVGRLALLSDAASRPRVLERSRLSELDETVPPAGSLALGFHARAKSVTDFRRAVCEALGQDPSVGDDALLGAVPMRGFVVLVDALDEAAADGPLAIAGLARRLADAGAGVIIATRPDAARAAYNAGEGPIVRALGPDLTIDLGAASRSDQTVADIAAYVALRLHGDGSSYAAVPAETVTAIAEAVAAEVTPSFLYARLAARELMAQPPIRLEGDWRTQLPHVGNSRAFAATVDADLARLPAQVAPRVRAMLMALAFAEGSGLPRNGVWAAIGRAVSALDLDDRDVPLVLRHASWYLVEGGEQGETVYRLYHEELVRHFRALAVGPDAEDDVHARITAALTPDTDTWFEVPAYVQRSLVLHAARAGLLPELLGHSDGVDLDALAVTPLVSLLQARLLAVEQIPPGDTDDDVVIDFGWWRVIEAVESAAHVLELSDDPVVRAGALAIALHEAVSGRTRSRLHRGWRLRAVNASLGFASTIRVPPDARWLGWWDSGMGGSVVTAGDYGAQSVVVRHWHAFQIQLPNAPAVAPTGHGGVHNRILAVVNDGRLTCHDLHGQVEGGPRVSEPVVVGTVTGIPRAVAIGPHLATGEPMIVTTADRALLWHLDGSEPVDLDVASPWGATVLADGRVAVGSTDGAIELIDVVTGARMSLRGPGLILGLAARGDLLAAAGSQGLDLWHLASGKHERVSERYYLSVTIGEVGGATVVAAGLSSGGGVRLWRVDGSAYESTTVDGHQRGVFAVALVESPQQPGLVSLDESGLLAFTSLRSGLAAFRVDARPRLVIDSPAYRHGGGQVGGRLWSVLVLDNGTTQVFDDDYRNIVTFATPTPFPHTVVVVDDGGEPAVVMVMHDGSVLMRSIGPRPDAPFVDEGRLRELVGPLTAADFPPLPGK